MLRASILVQVILCAYSLYSLRRRMAKAESQRLSVSTRPIPASIIDTLLTHSSLSTCDSLGLRPKPRHFSLWANSMETAPQEPSPRPLPTPSIVGSLESLLRRIGLCRQATRAPQQSSGMGDAVGTVASPCSHTMLLAQSEKCQGSGDSVPGHGLLFDREIQKDQTSHIIVMSPRRVHGWQVYP
jgi:hypothetical protein